MRRGDDLGMPDEPREGRSGPAEPPRAGVSARHVLIAIFAIVLIAFAIANFKPVRVNFLLFDTQARVVTVIVVAAVLGFVIGWFVGRPSRIQRRILRKVEDERD